MTGGLLFATCSYAAPLNFKQFDNLVGKYVKPDSAPSSKAVCICLDEGEGIGRVGVLRRSTVELGSNKAIEVRCMIPFHDRDSDALAFERRCPFFVPFVRDPPPAAK